MFDHDTLAQIRLKCHATLGGDILPLEIMIVSGLSRAAHAFDLLLQQWVICCLFADMTEVRDVSRTGRGGCGCRWNELDVWLCLAVAV